MRTVAVPPKAETYRAAVPISRFIGSDFAIFAAYSVERSIPSVCDGLRTCSRKIIWTVLEGGHVSAKTEIKVAQIAAATSAKTQYLHGKAHAARSRDY